MREPFNTIAYGAIAVMLTIMFAWAWYAEYANTPVHYTTIQTVDEGGFEHDCLVATYKKEMELDCTHPND
nr:MAG: hypothetical protein [Bacteriophage sp.]